MKTLIIILLSFQSFAQDSIPCDMTRQQSRLYFGVLSDRIKLEKRKAELADDQHKRENTKELKFLRYEFRTFKVRTKALSDSLENAHNLEMRLEKNRSKEKLKASQSEAEEAKMNYRLSTQENKLLKTENRKKVNANIIWIVSGILGGLILLLIFRIYSIRK